MGSKKKKTTQTYTPPSWVESGAKQAVGLGQQIGSQQYQEYGGQRVAGLHQNEQMGIDLARSSSGAYQPYFNQSRALAERGSQQFTDANMQDYMNPYVEQALDPAARKMREQGARRISDLDARAASMDAFGGSRSALMRSEAEQNIDESIGDLYKTGMSDAFDRATQLWGADRARDMMASGQIMNLGQAVQQANVADVNTLMNTGATDRRIQQAMMDFDYQEFVEERDWDIRNLGGLITALQGTAGSYSTTQTREEKQSGDALGQALGLAATVVGAIYGGPAGASAGASIANAVTGGGESGGSDFAGGILSGQHGFQDTEAFTGGYKMPSGLGG